MLGDSWIDSGNAYDQHTGRACTSSHDELVPAVILSLKILLASISQLLCASGLVSLSVPQPGRIYAFDESNRL